MKNTLKNLPTFLKKFYTGFKNLFTFPSSKSHFELPNI